MRKIYLLSNQKHKDVINLEVFKINYIKTDINLDDYDALVVTSKNAIYSLDMYHQNKWKEKEIYAIAPKTAQVAKKLGASIAFTGLTSHGNEFAEELVSLLKNKKVLYVRAKRVVSNLFEILKQNNINVEQTISYETVCNDEENINLEEDSIFIFTSPSSIECFFKHYSWHESYKAIAIGKTTANYLPKDINYTISQETSIEECIKLAKMDIF